MHNNSELSSPCCRANEYRVHVQRVAYNKQIKNKSIIRPEALLISENIISEDNTNWCKLNCTGMCDATIDHYRCIKLTSQNVFSDVNDPSHYSDFNCRYHKLTFYHTSQIKMLTSQV